jgi:hypothetical protein
MWASACSRMFAQLASSISRSSKGVRAAPPRRHLMVVVPERDGRPAARPARVATAPSTPTTPSAAPVRPPRARSAGEVRTEQVVAKVGTAGGPRRTSEPVVQSFSQSAAHSDEMAVQPIVPVSAFAQDLDQLVRSVQPSPVRELEAPLSDPRSARGGRNGRYIIRLGSLDGGRGPSLTGGSTAEACDLRDHDLSGGSGR